VVTRNQVNIRARGIALARRIGVLENSKALASQLIPAQYRKRWNALSIPRSQLPILRVELGWPICKLYGLLAWDQECAGTFGPEWIIVVTGTMTQVQGPDMPFTWHSHIDGICQFSHNDWWSFLKAETIVSLLLTRDQCKAFVKRPSTRIQQSEKWHCYHKSLLWRWLSVGYSDERIGTALDVDVYALPANFTTRSFQP
jgi:hypothetical protein